MEMTCPYCGKEIEIDFYEHEEDETYQHECPFCEKQFVYNVFITFSCDTRRADCLNGGNHDYQLTNTYPKEFSKMRCSMCGDERDLTNEERKQFGIGTKEDYFKSLNK